MSTRSLTIFENRYGEEIVVMYRQMDGYPDGHGLDLCEFLNDFKIVNGISGEDYNKKTANGMECLAAQVIAHFKDGVGGFYLHPAGTRNADEAYRYYVYPFFEKLCIRIEKEVDREKYEQIFKGSVKECLTAIKNSELD